MPVDRDWSAFRSEKPMSLILDALRKAEREREIGQAPTIGSQLPLRRRSQSTKRWPLVAGLALVVLSAGAVIGWIQRDAWWPAPDAAGEPAAEAALAGVDDSSESAAAQAPSQAATSADLAAPSQSEPAPSEPAPSEPASPVAAAAHPDKLAAMETAPTGNTADAAEDAPRIAAEALAVAAAAKAEAEKASAATANPTQTPPPESASATGSSADEFPATGTSAATGMAPDPAGVPAPGAEIAKPVAEVMPAEAQLPPVPLVWELALATRQSLPKLTIAMHVWNVEPTRRFVIVNDQRLVEGEAAAAGVSVSEIRREGVVFEFQGQRFLLPRGGI